MLLMGLKRSMLYMGNALGAVVSRLQ